MLLYDPRLRRLETQIPDMISGTLINTDLDLIFRVDNNTWNHVNFSQGPFMYGYRLSEIRVKIGKTNAHGSEHLVDGRAFSAELQLICYNSDLTNSLRDAQKYPYGVAIISIFAEATPTGGNKEFGVFVDAAFKVPWQGEDTHVPSLRLKSMLPDTSYYVTYEGSFTQPACQETVTWVLFNKPIKIKSLELDKLRQLMKKNQQRSGTTTHDSIRTPMPLNNRPIRTNINTLKKLTRRCFNDGRLKLEGGREI
ncbi:carbonic anhydrase-related protein 10-like Protein [Elysia marginata]|uniref:Carbonic anhydrase-related protein 10-like Protein n=1 Tax=Elysia marginata TaxID=1093978 RepID=A0AAV4JCL8_9GAST|nr:carbonic anhydrase-related protein 10-like Protein [Elysia marginata]